MPAPGFEDPVFLNVPFDRRYKALFEALIFAVQDCGFVARCALEGDDGSAGRGTADSAKLAFAWWTFPFSIRIHETPRVPPT